MRNQLLKLRVKNSTKAERKFSERLKSLRIPFRTKVKVNGREVDFIIKNYAIDIDGRHSQDGSKNKMLVEAGYIPVHIINSSVERISISYLK
jgi:very-short-patch-repair endonuclease